MFYDLNVPYTANHAELQRTLAFLAELGYNTVALSVSFSGKLPADLTCPIPSSLPFPVPHSLQILTRCTLTLNDPSQNHRLNSLATAYDLLAIRPTSEKTLQQTCLSLPPIDLISLDCTIRYPFYFRQKTLLAAIERGIRFEICYAQGILGTGEARRNLISNATQLVRATRGRGLVIGSEAQRALACRGPWDVVNLGVGWGLDKERAVEALQREARAVVVGAEMRRRSYRGVIDVIYGGEKPVVEENVVGKGKNKNTKGLGKLVNGGKRKADNSTDAEEAQRAAEKPLSKNEMKRRAAKARKAAMGEDGDRPNRVVESSTESKQNTKVAVVEHEDQG
ncbi:MAG: hypothetical protein Q9213_004694 [Squamulea squamosa]